MVATLGAWVPGSFVQPYFHCHSMDLPYRVIDPAQSQINVNCAASQALNVQPTLRNLYLELGNLAEIFPNGTEMTTLAAMHCL